MQVILLFFKYFYHPSMIYFVLFSCKKTHLPFPTFKMFFFIQLFYCSRPHVFCRKGVLTCNCIKKETLAQLFSCEFCELPKNNCFYRTPPVAASCCLYVPVKVLSVVSSVNKMATIGRISLITPLLKS